MNRNELLDRIIKRLRDSQPLDSLLQIKGKAFALLEHSNGEKELFETENLVTAAGDLYYAKRAVAEAGITPDFATGVMVLSTTGNAPAKGSVYSDLTGVIATSIQPFDATYPKRNDDDTDNTGRGATIVTYRRSYSTSQANGTGISRVAITVPSPVPASPLLMYAIFGTAFDKDTNTTIKIWVNHTFLGS